MICQIFAKCKLDKTAFYQLQEINLLITMIYKYTKELNYLLYTFIKIMKFVSQCFLLLLSIGVKNLRKKCHPQLIKNILQNYIFENVIIRTLLNNLINLCVFF